MTHRGMIRRRPASGLVGWVAVGLVWMLWGPAATEAANGRKIFFYHPDYLGSTHLVTDEQGQVVQRTEYQPFGTTSQQSGSVVLAHGFTGQRADNSTGLLFYNARYYDPQLGRFIQPDTFNPSPANPQAFNRYAYVHNNPVNLTDPSGNFIFIPILLAIAKIATVVSIGATIGGFIAAGTGHDNAANTFFKIAGFAGAAGALSGGLTLFNVATAAALVTSTGLSFSSSEGARQASAILGWTALGLQVGQGAYDYFTDKGALLNKNGVEIESLEGSDGLGINGILTDESGARGVAKTFESTALYNTSHGLLPDLTESGLQKAFGGGSLSAQAAQAFEQLSSQGLPLRLNFHSQGTIIGANALSEFASRGGRLPAGSSATFWGPAVTAGRAKAAFIRAGGVAENFFFKANALDPVPSMFGTFNPIRMAVGTVSGVLTAGYFHRLDVYTAGASR